ncbi:DNA phosphorothioation system sulfurtransferase DndC [Billgrantia azerbaijanica]|nr:DNA phosphorothioation system sulfurtransferase DndC [Halomonas azerbaijanica]
MSEATLFASQDEMLAEQSFAGRPLPDLITELQRLYLEDERPWVIGFSGGKDSTVVLSLIYTAIDKLPAHERHKHVYVVSSDTLVETPVVVDLISSTLDQINTRAKEKGLPFSAHKVVPKANDTFWVNLLGKGYPAPTQSFRWCTERMKIDPVSSFILDKVTRHGEVVVILGARSQESASRAQVIAKHKVDGSLLSKHSSLPGAYTYMPIEDWTFDEVWMYLLGAPAPWGGTHHQLFDLYKDSNAGECPVVIDTKTPSCGNSRFGCWTCTVVTKDRAMEGLIESGEIWMKRLKAFRDLLYRTTLPHNKTKYRNHKRRTGKVHYARGHITDDSNIEKKHIPGPYWMAYRQAWLKKLLEIQKNLNDSGNLIHLIHEDELKHIRLEWLNDPNEPDALDALPAIYASVYGHKLDWMQDSAGVLTQQDAAALNSACLEHGTPIDLAVKLLQLEQSLDGLSKRHGVFKRIDSLLNQDWGDLDTLHTKKQDASMALEGMQAAKGRMQDIFQENTGYQGKTRNAKSVYDELLAGLEIQYEELSK